MFDLNHRGLKRCARLVASASLARVAVHCDAAGTRLIDCGVQAFGGLEAGVAMAEVCLAGLARVAIVPGNPAAWPGPALAVATDQPVAACLASQYAGWRITGEKFFAMGSGPMRAAYGDEAIFREIGLREQVREAIGVLECDRLPPPAVGAGIAEKCGVQPEHLTLLVARTASLAGSLQVVARSVETALHKLHEIGFDVGQIRSGYGVAPVPPVAADDLEGIGRTNDAVLYGAEVTLWVDGDDAAVQTLGPQTPSCSSRDYGRPFREVFRSYDCDFYRIDPLLFSPAIVTFCHVTTGRVSRFGELRPDVLAASFGQTG